ncbi:hypothetical protein M9434_001292 [Picochlorum sp. BPE23]|nr:hypothetical protein M9434_001292 [Picochlorum sp. BPE23]
MGEHVGVSQARTAGVRVSKGELVMYLDSDNQMLPRYVSSMVAGFRIFKEEADALYSGQFILERGNLSSVRFGMLHKYLLYNKNFIDINCLAHTRKSFEKIGGFDKGLDRFVDWDLVLKYAAKNRLKALPIFESKYRINLENSISIDASLEAQMMQMRAKHTSRQSLASRPSHEWIYDHGSFPPLELDEFYSGLRIVIIKTSSVGLLACIKNIMTFVPQPRISVIDIHSTKKKGEHRIAIGGESLTILARNSRREAIAFALSYWGEDVLVLDSNARLLENSLPILAKLAFINHDDQVLVLERIVAGGSDELSQHMPYADPNYSCDVSISSVVSNVRILPTFFLHGVFYLNCLSIFGAFFRKSHSYDLQRALESLPFCEEMQHSEFFQIRHIEAPVLDATNFNGV